MGPSLNCHVFLAPKAGGEKSPFQIAAKRLEIDKNVKKRTFDAGSSLLWRSFWFKIIIQVKGEYCILYLKSIKMLCHLPCKMFRIVKSLKQYLVFGCFSEIQDQQIQDAEYDERRTRNAERLNIVIFAEDTN